MSDQEEREPRRPSLDVAPLYDADAEDAERAQEEQDELDKAVAERRAAEREELAAQEAANYARHHAIIERDADGNPIEKPEQE